MTPPARARFEEWCRDTYPALPLTIGCYGQTQSAYLSSTVESMWKGFQAASAPAVEWTEEELAEAIKEALSPWHNWDGTCGGAATIAARIALSRPCAPVDYEAAVDEYRLPMIYSKPGESRDTAERRKARAIVDAAIRREGKPNV